MISFFTAVSSGTWHSYLCVMSSGGAQRDPGILEALEAPSASHLRVQLTWPEHTDRYQRYHGGR
jgi:hypothetical protein